MERASDTFAEEHLAGIEAWFVEDIDTAREVGCVSFIEPVRISEPCIWFCDREQLTRSRVTKRLGLLCVQYVTHPLNLAE